MQDRLNTPAIIVDIDGTIAHMWDRGPFDWSRVGEDAPHEDMIALIKILQWYRDVLFVSWRSDECRGETQKWLNKYFDGCCTSLHMRKAGDNRKDSIVKYEILQELIKEYYIEYVFDDRDQVVKMWREAGLRCLQVAPGNF